MNNVTITVSFVPTASSQITYASDPPDFCDSTGELKPQASEMNVFVFTIAAPAALSSLSPAPTDPSGATAVWVTTVDEPASILIADCTNVQAGAAGAYNLEVVPTPGSNGIPSGPTIVVVDPPDDIKAHLAAELSLPNGKEVSLQATL